MPLLSSHLTQLMDILPEGLLLTERKTARGKKKAAQESKYDQGKGNCSQTEGISSRDLTLLLSLKFCLYLLGVPGAAPGGCFPA